MNECGLHGLDQILELVHIAADENRREMHTDRVDDAARRIARDDTRRRCLSVARSSRIRADEDNDILHAVYAPPCRFERDTQGNGEHAEFDLRDFHEEPPFVYRILSDMRAI